MNAQFLYVGKEDTFSKTLLERFQKAGFPGLSPHGKKKVFTALSDSSVGIPFVLLDSRQVFPSLITLIHMVRKERPVTPIFVIYDHSPPFSETELRRVGVSGQIHRSIPIDKVVDFINPFRVKTKDFDSQSKPMIMSSGESNKSEGDYVTVATLDMLSCSPPLFDLFVKTPSGKQVKVVSANEAPEIARIQNYVKLGLPYLYLKREAKVRSLNYLSLVENTLPTQARLNLELRFLHLAGQATDFIESTNELAGSAGAFQKATDFLDNLFGFIHSSKNSFTEIVSHFLQSASELEHSVNVAMSCALLAKNAGFETYHSFWQLGLAGLLHDIGKAKLPENQRHRKNSKSWSEGDWSEYRRHPKLSADTLSTWPEIDAITLQSIVQHHERRDGLGFPKGKGAGEITPFAELIGISDEMALLSDLYPNESVQTLVNILHKQNGNGFSQKTWDTFIHTFLPT